MDDLQPVEVAACTRDVAIEARCNEDETVSPCPHPTVAPWMALARRPDCRASPNP